MNKKLATKIALLELNYANHKPDCASREKLKLLNRLQEIGGNNCISIGGSGFKCNCGYDKLVAKIKIGIIEALESKAQDKGRAEK